MNITDKNTLKSWFLRGMKPLETQFAAWIDAYWHKSEQIPTSNIDGLEATLNNKAEATAVNNLTTEFNTHRDDVSRHKTSSEIRAEITENDIPDTIARNSEINTKIQTHDTSEEAHQDIREAITDIKNGDMPVKKSEYAKYLGTEGDCYTKAQLDSKINRHIKEASYDQTTARFTFTFEDETEVVVDTPVKNTVTDARYDTGRGELVLVLVSGNEIRIAAAGMTKTYSGVASATTTVVVNAEGVISADLKEGGVDVVHLSEALRDALNGYQTKTGDTKDNNVTMFTEAAERENIQPGENHGVLFGKIRKWFSSLGGLAFRDSVEPLNINYENGDSVVYRGTETLTVSVPGSGARKIVLKGTGLNRYGFYQLRAGERLYLTIDVIGIPVSESSRAFFQRVSLEGGVWIPTNNAVYMYPFVKEKGSVTPSDDGFWRWIVEYVDPVTLEIQLLSSNIFKMQYVSGKKFLVATDPMSFYKGYITSELGNISCCFEAVGFSEAATVKLQRRNMEGAWVDGYADFLILDGVRCVQVNLNVGEYQVVVTESDGKVYSSGAFRVKNPSECVYQVYVVTEYPQDLTEYADGTVFIKK